MISDAKKLISFLDTKDRVHIVLLLIPMLVIVVMDTVSIGLIIPLIAVISDGSSVANPYLARVHGFLELSGTKITPISAIMFFLSFFLIKNLCLLGTVFWINHVTHSKMASFMVRLYGLYLSLPYEHHLETNSSTIVRNLTQSAQMSFDSLRLALTIFLEALLVAGTCILLLVIEPVSAILATSYLAIFAALFYFILAPRFKAWGKVGHEFEAQAIKMVNHGLGVLKELRVGGYATYFINGYSRVIGSFIHMLTKSLTASQFTRLYIETVVVIGFMIAVFWLYTVNGSLESVVPTIGLFGMAAMRLMPSVNKILYSAADLKYRSAAISTLYTDVQRGSRFGAVEYQAGKNSIPFEKEFGLQGVSFNYSGAQIPALRQVSLTIEKNAVVGLVGPSGSGKTTMAQIILGLLKPSDGFIQLDGKTIDENLPEWQRKIGYVSQKVFILDDTVRRNIALGIPDSEIDESALTRAIETARLDTTIEGLSEGLDTIIGEDGQRLSGGQRQRIGIARALYRDPEVLVFDEATSALDNETEREISRAIDRLGGSKTIIVIAHRLPTVEDCDKIVFLSEGTICGYDSFERLYETNDTFRRFAQAGESKRGIEG